MPRFTVWSALIVLGGIAILALPVGREGLESFAARWTNATASEGEGEGAGAAVGNRMGGQFTEVFELLPQVPIAGHGIGAGTNVSVKLQTGGVGFLLGEAEWTRNVMEAGPLLGFTYIIFRLVLAFFLLGLAFDRMRRGDPLGWLFMGATFLNIIIGQTSQSTSLGFIALTSGLSLAAVQVMQHAKPLSENRRRFLENGDKARLRRQAKEGPTSPDPDKVRPVPGGVQQPR